MLVGLGGSGKQSLSRLAAFVCDAEVVQVPVSPVYCMVVCRFPLIMHTCQALSFLSNRVCPSSETIPLVFLLSLFIDRFPLQIEASASYSPADFREDVKKVMFTAGIEGRQVVFLLNDTQVSLRPVFVTYCMLYIL